MRAIVLCMTVYAGWLVLCPGCDSLGKPADLPEPGVKLSRSEWHRYLIRSARAYLEEVVRPSGKYYGQEALISGNLEAARRRLSDKMYREDRTPLAMYSAHGLDGQGRPYLTVTALNEHRETIAIWLMITRADASVVRARVALPIEEKDWELVLPHWFNIVVRDWKDFLPGADGQALELHMTKDRRVEMPSLAGCTVAVAIEDRTNGLSNFVVACEKDDDELRVPGN
jgi:hypothetical protein